MSIPGSPVAYWDTSNPSSYPGTGSTLYDLSVNGYDLQLGQVQYNAIGYKELGLTVANGNAYMATVAGNCPVITNTSGYTISTWVYLLGNQSGYNYTGVLGFGQRNYSGASSGVNMTVKSLPNASVEMDSPYLWGWTPGNSVPINQWINLVETCSPSTGVHKLYVNGVYYGTSTQPNFANTGTAPNESLFIGVQVNANAAQYCGFNGYFGAGAIYASELSAGQVTTLYNNSKDRFAGLQTSFDFQNPACFTNGGTTITDLTGNGNNFTINNTSYTYDSTLGAITFPSGTYADGTPSDYAFGTSPFSVLAWVKFNPSNPGINVFHFGGNGTGERTYFYWRSSDNLIVSDNSGSAGAWDQTADSQWHLLAITRPSSSLCNQQKVYLDGNLIAFSSSAYNPLTPLNATTGVARIHSTVYGATGDLVIGTFDVYTTELSSGDITSIYNNTKDRFYPNLVAQYDFSNTSTWTGSGTTAYDLSGYGNNLTLTNSPTLAGTGQSKVIVFNGTNQDARKTTPLSGLTGTPFTINTWVKWPTLPNPATFAAVWTYGSAYPSAQWNGLFKMLVNPYITYVTGLGATQITSSTTNAPDTFYNLIITNNTPNTLNLYINGVSVGTATQSFTFEGSAGLYVASNLGGDGFSDSQIALLEVYKTGFGSTDVTNLYNTQLTRFAPTPPPSSNGVGGRQFGQGFNG